MLSTAEKNQKRINQVIAYIDNLLDGKLNLEILPPVSNFYSFHFHRIIRAHLNEPLGSYIARVHLETAIRMIRYTALSLSETACKIGYPVVAKY
jgi:AraC family transcriptional regulator